MPSLTRVGAALRRAPRIWRHLVLLGVGVGVGLLTAGAQAQESPYPIFTPDTFVATMKTVAQNFSGATQALNAGDYDTAKSRAIRAREQLATTITFWRRNKRDDAVKMLQTATARFDALDDVLSKTPVDKDAASAAAKQIGGTCQACHAAYREQDPATKAYRIKL